MATDQKPSLTWTSAAKIAWRELQASRAKFLFVIISVAIGVAALTGVRGFSDSFQKTLLGEARSGLVRDSQNLVRLSHDSSVLHHRVGGWARSQRLSPACKRP